MIRYLFLLLLLAGFVTACHHPDSQGRTGLVAFEPGAAETLNGTAPVRISYERSRRFNELFLESLRQKYQNRIDAQYELLDKALQINPEASEAIFEMGMLKTAYASYSDTLTRAEGDSLLHRAVKLEPNNLTYKEFLAIYYANKAKYREAIRLYEEIAEAELTNETLATLIWLYRTSGDFAGAIRTIERLERIDGRSEQLSMEKFQTFVLMNDYEHAFQAIEDLCAEFPLDLRYRVLMGDLYDQHGYHEQALTIYRDVLTAEPENSFAQISLLAYYKAAGADSLYHNFLHKVVMNRHTQPGARNEALTAYAVDNLRQKADAKPVVQLFHEAFAAFPDNAELPRIYANYVSEKGMGEDSVLSAVNRVLTIEPDQTKARLLALQIMIDKDSMEQVARLCREGLLYEPSEVMFYYYEGMAYFMLQRNADAIRVLQKGAERIDETTDKELASDLLATLGDVLYDTKLSEEAFLAYDRALEYNANNVDCLNNYAYYLSVLGKKLDKAEEMSKKTVDIKGDDPIYLDTYAWILFLQGQFEQARIYMNEALRYVEETPENAMFFDHAGDIYFRCGDKAKAMTYWKTALKLYPEKANRQKVQRKIWRKRI